MDEGFIKIHRKITKWQWYTDATVSRVFIHLLLLANHEDNMWRGITVKRGQLITSYRHIAADLKLSTDTVHRAIKKLESTGELSTSPNARYTIITLFNYNSYQLSRTKTERSPNGSRTSAESNKNINITSNINTKNEKNEKKSASPSANEDSSGWKSRRDL